MWNGSPSPTGSSLKKSRVVEQSRSAPASLWEIDASPESVRFQGMRRAKVLAGYCVDLGGRPAPASGRFASAPGFRLVRALGLAALGQGAGRLVGRVLGHEFAATISPGAMGDSRRLGRQAAPHGWGAPRPWLLDAMVMAAARS